MRWVKSRTGWTSATSVWTRQVCPLFCRWRTWDMLGVADQALSQMLLPSPERGWESKCSHAPFASVVPLIWKSQEQRLSNKSAVIWTLPWVAAQGRNGVSDHGTHYHSTALLATETKSFILKWRSTSLVPRVAKLLLRMQKMFANILDAHRGCSCCSCSTQRTGWWLHS